MKVIMQDESHPAALKWERVVATTAAEQGYEVVICCSEDEARTIQHALFVARDCYQNDAALAGEDRYKREFEKQRKEAQELATTIQAEIG